MINIYNSLCEGCCNDDCNAKNICSKCKSIDTCETFKNYVDEYYNIIGKEEDEELELEELKNDKRLLNLLIQARDEYLNDSDNF